MLIADGGGGGGATDWAGMSIEMMRTLIQNPNIESHHQLLTGWQRSYELVSDHMMQVINYRDNLMAAWPPNKSAAAAVYRDRLNDLIDKLNATYEASMANHDAFASATLSISHAQHDFEAIWQEHETNRAKLAEYQNDLAMSSAATFDTTPPVTAMQQEAVRQKAIALMSSVSSDLALAQVRIVRPTPYLPSADSGDSTMKKAHSTYNAPPIPPITPTFAGGKGSLGGSNRRPVANSADTGAGGPAAAGGSHQPGLALEGAAPPINSPADRGVHVVAPPFTAGDANNPLPNATFLPSVGRSSTGGGSHAPTDELPIRGLPGESIIRPGNGIAGGAQAMPPGGLIGSMPRSGPGDSGGSQPGTRRVNPVGGVIGEGEPNSRGGLGGADNFGAGVVPGGHRSSTQRQERGTAGRQRPTLGQSAGGGRRQGLSMTYGQTGGRRSSRQGRPDALRWDPDNPWETEQGVDPVLLPAREQIIDPGPAIGLT